MARLYLTFKTNAAKKDEESCSPHVSSLTFKLADGNYLHIEPNGDEDYCVEKDGESNTYDSRWKGLDFMLADSEGQDSWEDWRGDDNSIDFQKLLLGAKPVAFSYDAETLAENDYDEDFIMTCQDVQITVESGYVSFQFFADELDPEDDFCYDWAEAAELLIEAYNEDGELCQYEYVSIEDMEKEYFSDDIDMNVPSNDAVIHRCLIRGVRIYPEKFCDLIRLLQKPFVADV